jgi:hypothetical protein
VRHRRIRSFNTRETYPEENLDNALRQAVVAGDTAYLRASVELAADGATLAATRVDGRADIVPTRNRAMIVDHGPDLRTLVAGAGLNLRPLGYECLAS